MTSLNQTKWVTTKSISSHQTTETCTTVPRKAHALLSSMTWCHKRAQLKIKITLISRQSYKWWRTEARTMELRTWFPRARGILFWRTQKCFIRPQTIGLMPRTSRALSRRCPWSLASMRRTVQHQSPRAHRMTRLSCSFRITWTFTTQIS